MMLAKACEFQDKIAVPQDLDMRAVKLHLIGPAGGIIKEIRDSCSVTELQVVPLQVIPLWPVFKSPNWPGLR